MKTIPFEILIATMNKVSLDFLYKMFTNYSEINFSILIINQTTPNHLLYSDNENIRVINSYSIGSSNSRNLALKHALGEILLISDDDVIFEKNFDQIIINSYKENPEASLICFQAKKDAQHLLRKYPTHTITHMKALHILNVGNIEISVNTKKCNRNDLKYNPLFGLNSKFGIGEESVFLWDLKTKKHTLTFVPKTIVLHPNNTTSDRIEYKKKYFAQGAIYTHLFNKNFVFWLLLKVFFDCKQQKLPLKHAINAFLTGVKGQFHYKKLTN